jgi:hypothetical protein
LHHLPAEAFFFENWHISFTNREALGITGSQRKFQEILGNEKGPRSLAALSPDIIRSDTLYFSSPEPGIAAQYS